MEESHPEELFNQEVYCYVSEGIRGIIVLSLRFQSLSTIESSITLANADTFLCSYFTPYLKKGPFYWLLFHLLQSRNKIFILNKKQNNIDEAAWLFLQKIEYVSICRLVVFLLAMLLFQVKSVLTFHKHLCFWPCNHFYLMGSKANLNNLTSPIFWFVASNVNGMNSQNR